MGPMSFTKWKHMRDSLKLSAVSSRRWPRKRLAFRNTLCIKIIVSYFWSCSYMTLNCKYGRQKRCIWLFSSWFSSAHWTGHLMFSLKTNPKLRIFTKCWPILPVLVVLFLLFSFIKTISFIGSKNRESTGFGIDVLHTKIQSYAKIDLYKSNFKKLN